MNEVVDTICRTIEFKQPIEKVWSAITSVESVRQWFGSDAHYELKEGSLGYFEWSDECEGKFAMQIVTIRRPTYFAWRWMQKEDAPFDIKGSTLVEWTLEETASGTEMTLQESGFAEARQIELNNQGWDQELADLVDYINASQGN